MNRIDTLGGFYTMKYNRATRLDGQTLNASQRIATKFLELLEHQFPIYATQQSMLLRSASDYASRLNVHVNHLNRALKEITQQTTTQIIAKRVMQESKLMLRQNALTVSEIAYLLGFSEVTHFNNFFKKHAKQSPGQFRNGRYLPATRSV